MNQFALKAQIQQQLRAMDEDGEQMIKTTKSLVSSFTSISYSLIFASDFQLHRIKIHKSFQKIKDEASSDENSDGEKGDDEDDAPVGSLKPKKVKFIEAFGNLTKLAESLLTLCLRFQIWIKLKGKLHNATQRCRISIYKSLL